jgi:hypothetical protein
MAVSASKLEAGNSISQRRDYAEVFSVGCFSGACGASIDGAR